MENIPERNITLGDYLRIVIRGRWIILFSFILVMGITIYYTYTAIPVYQASARLIIKENKGMQRAVFSFTSYMKRETMINNQVEILKSRSLSEKVIAKLKDSQYSKQLHLLGNTAAIDTMNGVAVSFRKTFAGFFKNEASEQEKKQPGIDELAESLRGGIEISPVRDTDIVELSFKAPSPFEAAYIVNTVAGVFKNENQVESQQEVRQVKNFLEDQLKTINGKLRESEEALKNYKEQAKLVGLPEETQELITKFAEFETLYRAAKLELESNQERLVYINQQLSKTKQNLSLDNTMANPVMNEMQEQMAEIQAKEAKLVAGLINDGVYDKDNPQLKKYNERINSLKERYKARLVKLAALETINPIEISETLFSRKIEIETEVQSLVPKVKELKKIVEQYNVRLESLPAKSLRLARLAREAKVDEKIYLMMNEKLEESRITEVGQLGNIRIIDLAKPPLNPISPKKRQNMLLGIILGLGLGIGICFMREYIDNSVRTIEDIQNLKMPILGSIPEIKVEKTLKKIRKKNKNLPKSKNGSQEEVKRMVSRLITHFAPKSPISEAYRTLRTNIQYSRTDHPLKTILVTSPGPKEGKSTTVVNLAITIAQIGSKTLLIDADLRRPVLHSIFGLSKGMGLTNCLVGKAELDEVIFKTEIANLSIMPSGTLPPNPSELLASSSMKKLIGNLKQQFEIILIDSPPIIAVTDAAILSSQMDGVIVVIKSAQTDRGAAQRASELLTNVKAPMLGALLNGVQVERMYGSYYYYYHYYYYYGKDGHKKRSRKAA